MLLLSAPDVDAVDAQNPKKELRRCKKCHSLLRPRVIWFGEKVDNEVIKRQKKNLHYVIFACLLGPPLSIHLLHLHLLHLLPKLAARGVPVAEFNLQETHH